MSIVNAEYRHIFIHVPKTGGTSMIRQSFVGGGGHQTAMQLVPKEPDWFSWGFVRNPYDRLFSIYCAAKQHAPRWKRVESLAGFEEFVLLLEDEPMVRPHTHPMVHFLCDEDGKLLVDFVGRFERIDEDWKTVCEKIGVEPVSMHHLNATKHTDWQEVYTPKMLLAVNRMYADDFAVFAYEKRER